jgi:hypothetical protein
LVEERDKNQIWARFGTVGTLVVTDISNINNENIDLKRKIFR